LIGFPAVVGLCPPTALFLTKTHEQLFADVVLFPTKSSEIVLAMLDSK
jgi:hypothetical protein